MTKESLQILKSFTTWGGVLITLAGITINIAQNGNWLGNSVGLAGLAITCCGHLINKTLAEKQATEYEGKMAELTDDVEFANKRLNDPDLQRLIENERLDYMVAHQDDGR